MLWCRERDTDQIVGFNSVLMTSHLVCAEELEGERLFNVVSTC